MGVNGVFDKGFETAGHPTGSLSSSSSQKVQMADRYSDENVMGTVKIVEDEEKELSRSLQERHIQMVKDEILIRFLAKC